MPIMPTMADSWDDFSNVDRMWDGQKSITNQEFEQVMEKLEEGEKKKEEKQSKKKIRSLLGGGKLLHADAEPKIESNELELAKLKEEGVLINLPVVVYIDSKPLEKGYYKLFAERDEKDNKTYVNFYQSQFLKARLQVQETEDDYGQDELDFAKIIPYNDSFVKFIFGSIDFNAYAFVPFVEN